MTPEQHAQRIRQLELQLEIADYGMGMPRDYQRVLWLREQLELARKRIITSHVRPPIPSRDHDWCAFHDGEEETGHYGWGTTRKEALADLERLDRERAEAMDSDFNEEGE